MKTKFFIPLSLLFCINTFSQIGINTENPKATFEISAKTTDGSRPEGIIIPKLTGDQIKASDAVYGIEQKGTLIYATEAVTITSPKTLNIYTEGYYFFDGIIWQALKNPTLGTPNYSAGNGLNTNNGKVELGGSLDKSTAVSQENFPLAFTSSLTNGFSIDGTTFSVDAANNRIGIGTTSPTSTLEIKSGTANTSGVKLTNLSASTPVSSGATLGVDTSGNIVTVLGNAFVPASGRAVLGSTVNINANTANYNLISFTLPAAGTYLITYSIRGEIQVSGGTGFLVGFLSTAASAASIISNTEVLITTSNDTTRTVIGGTGTGSLVVTVNGPTTYYAGIRSAGLAGIVFNNADGRTSVNYVKVTP